MSLEPAELLLLQNMQEGIKTLTAQLRSMNESLTSLVGTVARAQGDIVSLGQRVQKAEDEIRGLEVRHTKEDSKQEGAIAVGKPLLKALWLAVAAGVGAMIKHVHLILTSGSQPPGK